MPRSFERCGDKPASQLEERAAVRMLDAFQDVPGFVSLEKFLIRPFSSDGSNDAVDTIRKVHGSDWPRECSGIHVFRALLSHMTSDEKKSHVIPLEEMFKCLVARHASSSSTNLLCHCYNEAGACASQVVLFYVELFREGGGDTTLIGNLESLLTCFSDQRFHAGGIRESNFLMEKSLDGTTLDAVLIRHGFKYSFHEGYLRYYCKKLTHPAGPTLYHFVEWFNLVYSGNLRKQMAAEIIWHCESSRNLEYLCTLWRSVPDPFITPDELHHLMEPFFLRTPSFLVDACARYRVLIPWVPTVKQPRSLKHLARVRIRESMIRAHSIGEKAIRSLGLPKMLEDYLWKLDAF